MSDRFLPWKHLDTVDHIVAIWLLLLYVLPVLFAIFYNESVTVQ
jgi:hypothetical protein